MQLSNELGLSTYNVELEKLMNAVHVEVFWKNYTAT